jgi:hypothetical protein
LLDIYIFVLLSVCVQCIKSGLSFHYAGDDFTTQLDTHTHTSITNRFDSILNFPFVNSYNAVVSLLCTLLFRQYLVDGILKYEAAVASMGKEAVGGFTPKPRANQLAVVLADSMLAKDKIDQALSKPHEISCLTFTREPF